MQNHRVNFVHVGTTHFNSIALQLTVLSPRTPSHSALFQNPIDERNYHWCGLHRLELLDFRFWALFIRKSVKHRVMQSNIFTCLGLSSLVPRPRASPGEKRSGERSRISWDYYPNRVMTNEIARSVIIM